MATSLRHHTAGIKVASMFLTLKHLDTKGSGLLPASNRTYRAAAEISGRSIRTVQSMIERLEVIGLVHRTENGIELEAYGALAEYINNPVYTGTNKKCHYINAEKIINHVQFEYILRAIEEKESQDMQRYMKRQKMKRFHERLTLSTKEEKQLEQADLQGLLEQFAFGEEYIESCDPDTARGVITRARQMNQSSHTGAIYWQKRLESLGLIEVTRDRIYECELPRHKSRYSRLGTVFFSKSVNTTVLQLPNEVKPNFWRCAPRRGTNSTMQKFDRTERNIGRL